MGPCGDEVEVLHDAVPDAPVQFVAVDEQGAHALVFSTPMPRHLGLAHVQVEHDDPFATGGNDAGQVDGHERLAFPRWCWWDGDDLRAGELSTNCRLVHAAERLGISDFGFLSTSNWEMCLFFVLGQHAQDADGRWRAWRCC